jgi:phage-related minor tail protein
MKILEGIAGNMDNISSKEILFKFRTEGPAAALEYAKYLARGAEYGGLSAEDALGLAGISTGSNSASTTRPARGARANGGPVMGGGSYLVGERGPELFTPSSSGNITPNNALGGGGNTINITVTSADPNAVVRALQSYNRNVGRLPVEVQ